VERGLRTFYILTITQVLSFIGSEMTGLAIGIWLFTTTGNTTPLVLVPLFYSIPYILFSNIAGVLADRMSRRNLIILGDADCQFPDR
jgi:MFS transporter, DHA3 family, macrolide efflux protein